MIEFMKAGILKDAFRKRGSFYEALEQVENSFRYVACGGDYDHSTSSIIAPVEEVKKWYRFAKKRKLSNYQCGCEHDCCGCVHLTAYDTTILAGFVIILKTDNYNY